MSIVHPARLYINNDRRRADMYADQFSVQLQNPVQGLTRISIDTAVVEYNPEYPNFPPYASTLSVKFSDVVSTTVISVPNNVDWTSYTVNGQNTFPKNFQEYLKVS